MSASQCIKCEAIVGGYEKYCSDCVKRYGVQQNPMWHKTHWFTDWNAERQVEFKKDLKIASLHTESPSAPAPKNEAKQLRNITTVYIPNAARSGKQNTQPGYMKQFGSRPAK